MKIVKKILSEQHDYDWYGVTESQSIFNITPTEIKIGLMASREMGGKSFSSGVWLNKFVKILREKYAIEDKQILTRLILIFYFNSVDELQEAIYKKDISSLYRGPFYHINIVYNGDDINQDVDYETVNCEECGGDGIGYEDCDGCSGTGEIEMDDGEILTCDECSGSGYQEARCEICGGDGQYDEEEMVYILNCYKIDVISQTKIDEGTFSDISELFDQKDDFLITTPILYDTLTERNKVNLDYKIDRITDMYGDDMLSNNETLPNRFYNE